MNKLKGILVNSSPTTQLIALAFLVTLGFSVSTVIGTTGYFLAYGADLNWMAHPNAMRWFQLLSALSAFLLPAFGQAYLCSYDINSYLFIRHSKGSYGVFLAVCLSMILITPIIAITGYFNEQLVLPSGLSGLENWMRQQEDNSLALTQLFLSEKGILVFLFNVIVIAITAGIAEEFLFRGALSRILLRWTANPHIVIWVSAIIFSAFHLQFYGFIPRILLGAYMGYLLYWSRSIWLPVFAHIINNLIAIISMSDQKLKDNSYIQGDLNEVDIAIYLTVGTIMTGLFIACAAAIRKSLRQEKTPDDHSELLLP